MYEVVGSLCCNHLILTNIKLFHFQMIFNKRTPLDPPLRWPVTISLSQGGHFYEGFDVDTVVHVFLGIQTVAWL